jgi:hypothetical protein
MDNYSKFKMSSNKVFGVVFNLDELNVLEYIFLKNLIITNNMMSVDLREHGCNCQITLHIIQKNDRFNPPFS